MGEGLDALLWTGWGWYMAWKQDLAKLKQQLSPEPPAPAPKPKPVPKTSGPGRMEDEDAVFLSAMGLKPSPAQKAGPSPRPVTADPGLVQEPVMPETFHEAVKEWKGLKPMPRGIQDLANTPAPLSAAIPAPLPVHQDLRQSIPPVGNDLAPESKPQSQPPAPLRFQLAAGMALEVDASLDLRGHSLSDAMDRLKDRLGDGIVLGWRSLQVVLGPDPNLHEGLIGMLTTGQAPMVARYAQAPVPMGGTQAWLLYFGPSPTQP